MHLGTLSGTGIVFVGGTRIGTGRYEIHVSRDDSDWKSAIGTLHAEWRLLEKLFNADSAKLRLESGEEIPIYVTEQFEDRADIRITGPVPGF